MTFFATMNALPKPEYRKFPVFGRKWDQIFLMRKRLRMG